MERFFLSLACAAMVVLGSNVASAADFVCNVRIAWNNGLNTPTNFRVGLVGVRANSAKDAEKLAMREVWRTVKLGIPAAVWLVDLSTATCNLDKRADKSETPTTYNPKKQDPTERSWYCRVKTKWHMGPRSGLVDEGIYVTAPNETGAMGAALVRIQERVRTMFADKDKRKVTFSATDVSCK